MGVRRRSRNRRNWWAVLALALPLVLVAPAGASAPAGTVVASGLVNPRGIVVGNDGTLYVAESGAGGPEALPNSPEPGPPGQRRGATGRVTRVAPDGTKTVLAGGLPSFSGGSGPNGLVAAGGALWLVVGGAGFGYLSLPAYTPLPNEASVVRIDPQTGAVQRVADLGAYERANNPDKGLVDSNPWDLALGGDGNLYVSDAGGNDVLRVNPTSGQIGVAAVIPGQPGAAPNPGRGNRNEVDPVPTGVATGEDGGVYVATLPGGPTTQGAAKVIRIAPDGKQRDAATGLTYVVALTPGPDGLLYVTELYAGVDTAKQPAQNLPGRVVRIRADGDKETVADNLTLPGGTAFDAAGNLYVATNTATLGPPPASPQGQVVRFDRVAAPSAMPGLPNTGAGGGSRRAPALPGTALLVAAVLAATTPVVAGLRRKRDSPRA